MGDHGYARTLSLPSWYLLNDVITVKRIKKRIPMAEEQLVKVRELFDLYDSDSDNSLSLNELAILLQELGNKITALPAVRPLLPVPVAPQTRHLSARTGRFAAGQVPRPEALQGGAARAEPRGQRAAARGL